MYEEEKKISLYACIVRLKCLRLPLHLRTILSFVFTRLIISLKSSDDSIELVRFTNFEIKGADLEKL